MIMIISLNFLNDLKDFEALTPNLLARTVETVEGGGLVILLLRTMTSLKQLYTMTMASSIITVHNIAFVYFHAYFAWFS